MSLIADGLLIATCLTAAVYCYVLAGRLKKFASTEAGNGQQILRMSQALDETRAALREAQGSAQSEAAALERNILEARRLATQLRNLINEAQGAPPRAAQSRKQPLEKAAPDQEIEPAAMPAVGGLVAAAAVEVNEPPSPRPEVEEIDPAEIDVNELLAASAGEQQLGFLPDDDIDDLGADGIGIDMDDLKGEGESSDEVDAIANETGAYVADGGAASEAGASNLLKVERMAL